MQLSLLDLTFKDALPLIGTLLGGLLALLGGFLSPLWHERRRRKSEARNLALAFAGEITALREIAERRGYVADIQRLIEYIRSTGQPAFIYVLVRKEYFNVYKENVSHIGLLEPPLPRLIATFYTQANSILEDLETLHDQSSNQELLPLEDLLRCYEQLLQLLEDSLRGMFGIRVRTCHKNIAKNVGVGKTTTCTLTQVCVHP
jgi:hypothetical protein